MEEQRINKWNIEREGLKAVMDEWGTNGTKGGNWPQRGGRAELGKRKEQAWPPTWRDGAASEMYRSSELLAHQRAAAAETRQKITV